MTELTVGEEIPPFARTTDWAQWSRYAAVNDEFVGIHLDDELGRAAGGTGAFGMGNLQWAYLHNMLRDWLDERGRILSVSCQFRSMNTKGQQVSARGRITDVRTADATTQVELDVWTEDARDGQRLATGTATVIVDVPFDQPPKGA